MMSAAVKRRKRTERDELVAVCQHQNQCCCADKCFQLIFFQQAVKVLPRSPIALLNLAEPVLFIFAGEIFENFSVVFLFHIVLL